VTVAYRQGLGGLQGFLGFLSEAVDVHDGSFISVDLPDLNYSTL
jgi:hypothetical protein